MAEHVEVVIKIPKYYLTHPQDYICLAECVRRGTILPKGHGRLIDADAILEEPIGNTYEDIDIAETIIEADKAENKEYGVKVINRGNCMLCGKKLTEGLLFCKECEAKGK